MAKRVQSLLYADKMAEQYRSYRNFVRSTKTDATKAIYAESLRRFINFNKIENYDELLQWDAEEITDRLLDWVDSMTDSGLKGITIRAQLSGPELFLSMNRKMWHKEVVRKRIRSDDDIPGGDEPYTDEEIIRMLNATKHPRTLALVHFLASCGVRPGGFVDPVLRLKDLEEIEDCFSVEIYAGTKFAYWVFLTPEASKAMRNYLEWRAAKKYNMKPESPLFISFVKKSKKRKNRKTVYNEHLTDCNVDSIIRNLLGQAGITRKKVSSQRYDKAVLYGFRKRYDTALKNTTGINLSIAEKLMAHKTPKEIKLDANYFRPKREICFSEFKKAVMNLTLDPTERQAQKIREQETELTELQKTKMTVTELETFTKTQAKKIEAMEDEMKRYEQYLKTTDSKK